MKYRVRPFSFVGSYPNCDIRIANDLFFRSGRTLFSCTQNRIVDKYGRSSPDQPAFELENWTLQEVRFFSAMYIGNGEASSLRLYPLPIYRDFDIDDPGRLIEDGSLLQPLLEAASTDEYIMSASHGLVPKRIDQYHLWEWDRRREEQANLFWNALQFAEAPLIRGLHSLLKSEMLFIHFQFRDASLALSHIALDAAHSMVLKRLRAQGISHPTSKDAQAYIDDLWGVPHTGLKFFEDYYVDRIRNFHTDSRYGAETIPGFCIDDIWHLNATLKGVFYRLVTGKLHDETVQRRDDYLREIGLLNPR